MSKSEHRTCSLTNSLRKKRERPTQNHCECWNVNVGCIDSVSVWFSFIPIHVILYQTSNEFSTWDNVNWFIWFIRWYIELNAVQHTVECTLNELNWVSHSLDDWS